MKRQIIIIIEPGDDGMHCGECEKNDSDQYCQQWGVDETGGKRISECLAAEKLLRELEALASLQKAAS